MLTRTLEPVTTIGGALLADDGSAMIGSLLAIDVAVRRLRFERMAAADDSRNKVCFFD